MSSLVDIERLSQSDLQARWEEVLHQLLVSFLSILSNSFYMHRLKHIYTVFDKKINPLDILQ